MEGVDVAQLCRGYFGIVTAEYVGRKEFYYSWMVRGDSIHMQISDYRRGCPEDVLSDMCVMICRRAKGLKWSESDTFLDYVTSDDFILRNRPTYISRSRNLIRSDSGDVHNLSESGHLQLLHIMDTQGQQAQGRILQHHVPSCGHLSSIGLG